MADRPDAPDSVHPVGNRAVEVHVHCASGARRPRESRPHNVAGGPMHGVMSHLRQIVLKLWASEVPPDVTQAGRGGDEGAARGGGGEGDEPAAGPADTCPEGNPVSPVHC